MGSYTDHPSRLPYYIAGVSAILLLIAGLAWLLQRGDEFASLRGHKGVVRTLLFLPDGSTLISAGDDGTIRTWDTSSNSLRQTMQSHSGKVTALALVPRTQLLASAGDDGDRKSTRLNSSHLGISYAVFCLK